MVLWAHMKWMSALMLLLAPGLSLAQDSGLVTCTGADCNVCTFVQLISNIVNWLFGFLVLLAVLGIMYAGFQLVTSAGNTSALDKAKSMFTNIIIGFVIVLSAWIIVDTVMKAFAAPESKLGMWNQIPAGSCGGIVDAPEREPMYCFEEDNGDGDLASIPGLAACEERRQEYVDAGRNVNSCYLCSAE